MTALYRPNLLAGINKDLVPLKAEREPGEKTEEPSYSDKLYAIRKTISR